MRSHFPDEEPGSQESRATLKPQAPGRDLQGQAQASALPPFCSPCAASSRPERAAPAWERPWAVYPVGLWGWRWQGMEVGGVGPGGEEGPDNKGLYSQGLRWSRRENGCYSLSEPASALGRAVGAW